MIETAIGLVVANVVLAVLFLYELKAVKEIQQMAKLDLTQLEAAQARLQTAQTTLAGLVQPIRDDYAALQAKIQELINQGQFDPTTQAALDQITASLSDNIGKIETAAAALSATEQTVPPVVPPATPPTP